MSDITYRSSASRLMASDISWEAGRIHARHPDVVIGRISRSSPLLKDPAFQKLSNYRYYRCLRCGAGVHTSVERAASIKAKCHQCPKTSEFLNFISGAKAVLMAIDLHRAYAAREISEVAVSQAQSANLITAKDVAWARYRRRRGVQYGFISMTSNAARDPRLLHLLKRRFYKCQCGEGVHILVGPAAAGAPCSVCSGRNAAANGEGHTAAADTMPLVGAQG